jgi:hypothetical protein
VKKHREAVLFHTKLPNPNAWGHVTEAVEHTAAKRSEISSPSQTLTVGNIAYAVSLSAVGKARTMLQTAPQVFTTLIIGLLMAFAFQLVLTNLGLAVGITALVLQPNRGDRSKTNPEKSSGSWGSTIRTIGLAAGFGILLTINIVLFAASFLSVRLSLIADPWLGCILGIVIWSAYLLILTWASSTTIGSLAGSVFGSLTSGFRMVMSAVKTVLNREEAEDDLPITSQMLRQEIRQDVKEALETANIQELLEAHLKELQPPQPDLNSIRRDLEALLTDPTIRSLPATALSSQINHQTFVNLLRDRTNLSQRDVEHIVTQLDDLWQQAVQRQAHADLNTELLNFLQRTNPEELKFDRLTQKLEELLAEENSAPLDISVKRSSILDTFQPINFKALLRTVLERVDLSDLDVENIWHQLQTFRQQISASDSKPSSSTPFNIVRADVENYLLNSYPWNLERKTIQLEFEDVIYDTEADPTQIRPQLEQLKREDFVDLLNQRQDLSVKKVDRIADRLEAVRVEVLQKIQLLEADKQSQTIFSQVKTFFQSIKKVSLKPKAIQRSVKSLLSDTQAEISQLVQTLQQFGRSQLRELLDDLDALQEQQIEERLDDLETLRDRLIDELKVLPEQLKADIQARWTKLESYLLHTATERLTPKNVKRKLQNLFKDSLLDVVPLDLEESTLDREKWLALLKRRQSLTSDAIHHITEQIEETWHEMTATAKPVQQWTEDTYNEAIAQLAEYIQKFSWTDLNPADFKQSLLHWMNNPKTEAIALELLTFIGTQWGNQNSTDKLYKLLSQQGLQDVQIHHLLNRLQEGLHQVLKTPRRWITRTKKKSQDFANHLHEYLRYGDLSEMNLDSLQTNLRRLLSDFQSELWNGQTMSFDDLSDRLSQLHPTALRATLSERKDFSETETDTILQTIESTINQWFNELEQSQHETAKSISAILTKLQSYFDTLNLPDISSDAVEQLLHKVLHIPQVGLDALGDSLDAMLDQSPLHAIQGVSFEELRDRLQEFNRDTLANVLEGRDDISQWVASRITEQIEGTRDRLLATVETLQQNAQTQLETLKQETQRKAKATRRAAAIAAWWLFSITLTSGVTAAIAGFLAAT